MRFKNPPCLIGPLSEKPRPHLWEIRTDVFGNPLIRLNDEGLMVYHTACIRCGINDKNAPRF